MRGKIQKPNYGFFLTFLIFKKLSKNKSMLKRAFGRKHYLQEVDQRENPNLKEGTIAPRPSLDAAYQQTPNIEAL